jgi:hypothetical protein
VVNSQKFKKLMISKTMEDISLAALLWAACLVKWPMSTATITLSIPIRAGVHIHGKLKKSFRK